ncbi:cold-inducible protein YdjO-related protein [Sinobaca sp. H24]|uniref:cold-inducible protein YdjO-related protein n=1 Tax=Sinobaca sp. H24 TaxID=2923376 RepID=UPI00207B08B0|nr:cold-inducible protein YdjO-related protein [Sinobaca sp. H24]
MEQLPEERKIVKAWLCTNEDCIVWVKIQTQEDDTLQEKTCPICKSKMEKGEKEVIIAQRRNGRR